MSESATQEAPVTLAHTCAGCGTAFPLQVLSCPKCQRLAYADRLKALSAQAAAHASAGDREAELSTWRSMLELLPEGSRQHAQVAAKIEALVAALPAGARSAAQAEGAAGSRGLGKLAALGGVGLFLWKFKFVIGFVLTKAKLLLFGLTKMSTLLSMLLSVGVYWSLWGWQFALGLVLSIYVHEIGHVAALKRLGIAATSPMFIPGLGAFIRSKQYPASPAEDAEVGLAGPIWGLGAALACFGAGKALDAALLLAIAQLGAWINLFNLLPVWSLDGGRGFRALNKRQRVLACAAIGAVWFWTEESLLVLLLIAAAVRVFERAAPAAPHPRTLYTYAALVAALGWLATQRVDVPREPAAVIATLHEDANRTMEHEATP